jgi:integrase
MYLCKRSNGIYYVWFTDEYGRKQKISTRSKVKSDALNFLQGVKEGQRNQKLSRISLSRFTAEFLHYSASVHRPNTQDTFKSTLGEFERWTGDLPMHRIGVREIECFLAKKKTKASEHTMRKYFVTLSSAFERARRWGYVAKNPFKEVEKPKTKELQPAHFSKVEFYQLIATIEDNELKGLCIVAVSTGLRMSELISLEWTSVDFVRKVITVQNSEDFTTKSRKNRVIPMNESIWRLLALRKETAICELVFHEGGRKYDRIRLSKSFKRCVIAAGLDDKLHFHSLRHTFATWLVQNGVGIYEVQKLMGHSTIAVTQVYAHLAPSELHSAVEKIALSMN